MKILAAVVLGCATLFCTGDAEAQICGLRSRGFGGGFGCRSFDRCDLGVRGLSVRDRDVITVVQRRGFLGRRTREIEIPIQRRAQTVLLVQNPILGYASQQYAAPPSPGSDLHALAQRVREAAEGKRDLAAAAAEFNK